jgi:tryptophan halogenase
LPPFDHFSPLAEMARAGRIPSGSTPDIQAGLQLTTFRYREMMRAYALHLGVHETRGQIIDVSLHSDNGMVKAVHLPGNEQITADLYLDCSGPAAILRSRVRSDFVGWSSWLPCDRLQVSEGNPVAQVQILDRITVSAAGWRWSASSPERSSKGLAYSSAHARDGDLEQELLDLESKNDETIEIGQGRWADLWVGNCVAIGDAAVVIEPLEWSNLHLAHSQIDRVVTMMPSSDCNPIEIAEFNRQCAAEADRVRDFVCLHYVCSRRHEPFWKDARSITPPESLAHSLSLFSERGRLPFYEEETFSRDSWLAVLLGQGFEPRAIDPLAEVVSPGQASRAFASMGQSLSSFTLPAAPAPPELNPHGIR